MSKAHAALTLVHKLENWAFANAAARNAAGAYVAADIGKIGFQNDNGHYYRLTATTPTWIDLATPQAVVHAFTQVAASLTGQTSAANPGVMMGFGVPVARRITPTGSGLVVAMIGGYFYNDGAAGGVAGAQMRYFSGNAPALGAAPIGNVLGPVAAVQGSTANEASSLNLFGVAQLVVGTQYWFDAQVWAAGGIAHLDGVAISLFEIPA